MSRKDQPHEESGERVHEVAESEFAHDVLEGLSSVPKHLPSRYFYDERGDELFQKIMHLPEYYPSRCEAGILNAHKVDLLELIGTSTPFRLVEFGAGDGSKTRILLSHFLNAGAQFTYTPIDISAHILEELCGALKNEMPKLACRPQQGEYFQALKALDGKERKVVLFMGANIGNFTREEAVAFLAEMKNHLSGDDLLIIGFDLKKDPQLILQAYDDVEGVTREFNLNILDRINRELDADFDRNAFMHTPTYDPETGETKSFLVSEREQVVRINALDRSFAFMDGERVQTEISQKYDLVEVHELAERSGFKVVKDFADGFFADSCWKVR